MKYYRVFAKKEYQHNGEDKVRWLKVGEIKETDRGGRYLKLFLFPDTDFVIFPDQNNDSEKTNQESE